MCRSCWVFPAFSFLSYVIGAMVGIMLYPVWDNVMEIPCGERKINVVVVHDPSLPDRANGDRAQIKRGNQRFSGDTIAVVFADEAEFLQRVIGQAWVKQP